LYFSQLTVDIGEKYCFIQNLITLECKILEITGAEPISASFLGKQVDFYLPQAKLVIEIFKTVRRCKSKYFKNRFTLQLNLIVMFIKKCSLRISFFTFYYLT
jgi:hypothetical protein